MNDIRKGRVFFLGAGFSAGAGVPLTNVLLPKASNLFRQQAGGLFERIGWFASDADVSLDGAPDAQDLARLCTQLDFMELREHGGGERWSAEGSRERLALKYFFAKAVATSTPRPAQLPDYYHQFANGLRTSDVIVSFNWDTLVENLLDHVGMPYTYVGDAGKILIMKLHGSIHWREGVATAMVRDAPNLDFRPIGYSTEPKTDIHYSTALQSPEAWRDSHPLTHEVRPLIVLPGYGKAVDVRLLSSIWYRPEMLNICKGGISVIGLSVAEDDYIVDGLLRYLFRSAIEETTPIRILNPDPQVGSKFSAIAGRNRVLHFKAARLSEATVPFVLFKE
ncbi:MAG: hypothetical protein KJ981_05220 [Alphaproteobacteria bacterium]|nr:hypothetical protein [Alphaproteobacteria bacterium]MBU0831905.1 hypothetical protein [Alphaproteobacteria bacterium]MBU1763282.1 hypothetical protein [Alphaproteobacteria bacterium]